MRLAHFNRLVLFNRLALRHFAEYSERISALLRFFDFFLPLARLLFSALILIEILQKQETFAEDELIVFVHRGVYFCVLTEGKSLDYLPNSHRLQPAVAEVDFESVLHEDRQNHGLDFVNHGRALIVSQYLAGVSERLPDEGEEVVFDGVVRPAWVLECNVLPVVSDLGVQFEEF